MMSATGLRTYAVLLFGIFCAAGANPLAAQDFSGYRGRLPTSEWLSLRYASDLPIRPLLSDRVFSESRLGTSYGEGGLRTYQHPQSSLETSLSSYGLTSFKNLRLEGQFSYQKQFQDGVGWKLGRAVYHRPYYFANIKPGDWDNDRYALDLRGGASFLNDRLLAALGVDYQVEQLARYNDPRPSINYYNLFLKAQLGARLGDHVFAFYFGTGDAEENGGVGNYNEVNDSFGEREYNIITATGLGSYDLVKFSRYEKPATRSEIGLTYGFEGEALELTGELVRGRDESEFTRMFSRSRETVGTYRRNRFKQPSLLPYRSRPIRYRPEARHATRTDTTRITSTPGRTTSTQAGGRRSTCSSTPERRTCR